MGHSNHGHLVPNLRAMPAEITAGAGSERRLKPWDASGDRSREILVSAGSQGDLARDSSFASPAGWTLTKSPSEEPG